MRPESADAAKTTVEMEGSVEELDEPDALDGDKRSLEEEPEERANRSKSRRD